MCRRAPKYLFLLLASGLIGACGGGVGSPADPSGSSGQPGNGADGAQSDALDDTGGAGDTTGADDGDEPTPTQPASATARVRFKNGHRYAHDLATALALTREELCLEMSSEDCVDTHNILLGGVEPYNARIDEPLPVTSQVAPLAIERIALSACGERAARDFSDPDRAVLVGEVAEGSPSSSELRDVSGRIYERILRREANALEIDALVSLYDELDSMPRAWAQLSCFAVATTSEALFY